ncbi:MAG: spore cortex-lytic enzyme [Clostridiales bacterium]|nr:spore cortex-lytic enzyme [Clostridiales bacterium]
MKKFLAIGALTLALSATAAAGVTAYNVTRTRDASDTALELSVETAVLRQGSTGGEVKEVQRRLKQWGYYTGAVDGVFGAGTKKAVIAFQKKNGLTADGVVGKSTYAALGMNESYNSLNGQNNKKPSGSNSGSSNYTSSDLYVLAKAIYAEGRGESYTGQVAIGAVIMNRVKSSSFPNSIAGVVYQKGAFTAVDDGQINLEPNQTAYDAARDAMNGWDPTYGCLYYYNPAVATSAWIFNRQTVTVIGKHVFAI